MFVRARVCNDPVDPGPELRFQPERLDADKDFEESLLCYIARDVRIAAEMISDRINPVLIGLEQGMKSRPVPVLTGFDQSRVYPAFRHPSPSLRIHTQLDVRPAYF